tara:strand:- start:3866 stop:4075 length:210 start_codon:yes stop_codon:yes gene_type:complete
MINSKKEILKEIDNQNLSLHKDEGVYYFFYDDGNVFESLCTHVLSLNDLPLSRWKDMAVEFINQHEGVS